MAEGTRGGRSGDGALGGDHRRAQVVAPRVVQAARGESLRRIRPLSAALAEVESNRVIVDERDEAKRDFESWKETMEKDAAKRDKLAEEKLQAAFAETAEVRQELALAKRKLEEVGLTKEEPPRPRVEHRAPASARGGVRGEHGGARETPR